MHKIKLAKPTKKEVRLGLKITVATITLVSTVLIFYTLLNQNYLESQFSDKIQTYGVSALFILAFLLDLIPQLISPIMTLAASLTTPINPHYAILSTALGSTLGSMLGYKLGKSHMYQALRLTTAKESRKKMTRLTNKYGKIAVPLMAISPLPYLPILLGAINLSRKNFLIYGIIPRVLSFIIFGYLIKTI